MKPGIDIPREMIRSTSVMAFRGQEPKVIGRGEIKISDFRSDLYDILATRNDRAMVEARYRGRREGTSEIGLPLAGPRGTTAWEQTGREMSAERFAVLCIFGEDDN